MELRQVGKSDVRVSSIMFGAWAIGGWMWGGTDDDQAIRGIHAALDNGITTIDTAPIYGMGHSEEVVGRAIKGRRNEVVVATKCGMRWDRGEGEFYFETEVPKMGRRKVYRNLRPESVREECEASLRRLGVEVIDIYQCHWPDSTTPVAATMEALLALQQEGKVRAIGVSNFSPEQMAECLRHGRIDSDQPKYNALERGIEADVLPFCREHGLSVFAYSPIAQGLLTGKVTLDREFPEGDVRRGKALFSAANRQKVLDMLERLRPLADDHGVSFAQLFLAWTAAQPGLTAAIAGARDEKQGAENARAGDIGLSEDEARRVRDAVETLGLEK